MNRLNLLSHLFARSARWRRISVWSALLSTSAAAVALGQPAPGVAPQRPDQVFAQAAASDAFVMNQPPSGSLSDPGNYSRDIGIGGTGALARMGHIAGDTVGRSQSITHFEVMPYAFVGNTMWYTDGRFYTTNNGTVGGTGGVGVRQFLPNYNSIIGVGGFYDADGTRTKTFTQAGLSIEYLSEWLDVRTNLYANTGRKSAELGTSFVRGSERFVDNVPFDMDGDGVDELINSIAFNTQTRRAAATDGIDLTITVPVPGQWAQAINLEASAGGYHYVPNDFSLADATGYRLRLDGDFLQQTLHAFVDFTSDKVFNNNVVFGADLNYYHDVQRRPRIGHNQFNRMAEWVRRNYNVVAIDQTVINADELAINPVTGDPYTVLHVRNIVPADPDFPNFPAPAGDGTSTTPYQFITEAQADPIDADIIFVHAGSVFTGTQVILEDNQQILGEGVDHPIRVANAVANNGTILVPTVTVPPNPAILPILQNSVGPAVTLANNSVFAGFQINDTNGTAIFANGITGSEVRDVAIDGTTGLDAHGVHIVDSFGTIRFEQVTTTNVEGVDLFLDGGNSTVNWFGGQLNNTAGRAVVIQDQTGGTINLAGDNATAPAQGFGGLTITDNGGQGILIDNTSAAVVFGRSSDTLTSVAGVTLNNSTTTGVQITDLQSAGSVSFLRGLEITDAADIALDIQNSQGDFLLADDTTLANDLLILGRGANTAISLNNIGNLSQIVFLGDTLIGAVPDQAFIEDPAITFFNGSAGEVRFEGDLAIGTFGRTGETVAANGVSINIGDLAGIQVNATGAQFFANGNVTIEQNAFGPAILVANDPATVTFGTTAAPAQVVINPDANTASSSIELLANSGNIRFNSSVAIDSGVDNQINIIDNTGNVNFGSVTITSSDATVLTPIVNIDSNASVAFNSLSIENTDSLSLRGVDNDSLTFNGGTINSQNGPAIDLINNTVLSATFDSVTAEGYGPFPFGIRVIDDQTISVDTGDVITNDQTLFRIRGSGTDGSGGRISSGITADLFNTRGAIFQNIATVELNDQVYEDIEGLGIFVLNSTEFTLDNTVVSNTGRAFQTTTLDPEGFHQILIRIDQDIEDFDTYEVNITNSQIEDIVEITTDDAMVQIETTTLATGATLNLSLLDNLDSAGLVPGFSSARDLNSGAAVRVDWRGNLNASIQRNAFELANGSNNQFGLDIIQRGSSFTNDVLFTDNFLTQIGIVDDSNTGVRMDFAGATDLAILNNSVVNQTTGAVTPGFIFAGTNATGFDLRLRTAGNTVVFDDNFLDFNNTGGTGLVFSVINTSDVTIGDDTGTLTNFGNRIELTDTNAAFDRGIIFQTTFGTVNLFGNRDNIITSVPAPGFGTFVPFQPPGTSTGTIIVNGVAVP
jgi:hypothetical protein